jgi:hypothetical protein
MEESSSSRPASRRSSVRGFLDADEEDTPDPTARRGRDFPAQLLSVLRVPNDPGAEEDLRSVLLSVWLVDLKRWCPAKAAPLQGEGVEGFVEGGGGGAGEGERAVLEII